MNRNGHCEEVEVYVTLDLGLEIYRGAVSIFGTDCDP